MKEEAGEWDVENKKEQRKRPNVKDMREMRERVERNKQRRRQKKREKLVIKN